MVDLKVHSSGSVYCLTFEENDPYHDVEMCAILGISYDEYLKILQSFNGKTVKTEIKYSEDDILETSETWFDNYEDCVKVVDKIKSIQGVI